MDIGLRGRLITGKYFYATLGYYVVPICPCLASEIILNVTDTRNLNVYTRRVDLISKVENWIERVNRDYAHVSLPCSEFENLFRGYFSPQLLNSTSYVITDNIPKPDFPELHQMGLDSFIDMDVKGITYNNIYYLTPDVADDLEIHFHELVHAVQWNQLTPANFIARYIREIITYGYEYSPLEEMAYALQNDYQQNTNKFDVESFVRKNL